MNVIVRRAKPKDLVMIQQLGTELMLSVAYLDPLLDENWYFSEEGTKYLLSGIRGKNHICLVAEVNNKIIGYAIGKLLKTESWRPLLRTELGNLVVTERYRSHGVGHQLIEAFTKFSKDKGVVRIKVVVDVANSDAIRFYEANGYKPYHLTMEADC